MKTNPHRGRFIVFEGLDGSGQTTQAQLLTKWFIEKRGQLAYYTKEPSDGPIGALLKLALSSRLVCTNGAKKAGPLDEVTMALFFAADRADHLNNEIIPKLKDQINVICDRYYLSSLAYQSVNVQFDWIYKINTNSYQPDITFFLDVPPAICVKRMHAQRWHVELYEDLAILEKVHQNYLESIRKLRYEGERIEIIDGNQPPKDVHKLVVQKLKKFLKPARIAKEAKDPNQSKQQLKLINAKPLTESEIAARQDG